MGRAWLKSGFARCWLLGAAYLLVAEVWVMLLSRALFGRPSGASDTYYVLIHPQGVVTAPAAFLAIAAVYWVLEAAAQLPLSRSLGWAHFATTIVGVTLTLAPTTLLLTVGMPGLGVDPRAALRLLNLIPSMGYLLILAGMALFIWLLIDAGRRQIAASHLGASAP
jgi:heme/copper-type cytochrome/quinol oxidase subunit 1